VEIHENPQLAEADTLHREIKAYVDSQFAHGKFTANSRTNRLAVLLQWAVQVNAAEPRELTAQAIQDRTSGSENAG